MTTVAWSISQMDRHLTNGGVTMAHWRADASDGEYSASVYGAVGFTPDPTSPSFKPYEQLTEAEVLEWVWNSVVGTTPVLEGDEGAPVYFDKAALEASLSAEIDYKKNPPVVSGVPWA